MAAPIGNKFALGLETTGRPPIYTDDEEGFQIVQKKCNDYFNQCAENDEKATVTGLALFLGFSSRGTLNEYAKKEVFSDVIKRAMLAVENSYETNATAFDIFALKNMGWKDTQVIDQSFVDKTPPPKIVFVKKT